MSDEHEHSPIRPPHLINADGRTWFTRDAERRVFFILTVIMLAVGILCKIGVI